MLTIVEPSSSLVGLVVLPLAWAALAAVAVLRAKGSLAAVRVTRINLFAVLAAGGTLGLSVFHLVRAAQRTTDHVATQHLAQLARLGQLDLSIDLERTRLTATCAFLVALLAFAAVLQALFRRDLGVLVQLGWTGLAASAAFLVVLSADLASVALGLPLVTLASWGLARGGLGAVGRPSAVALALAGNVAVVFGAWVLFWSLGGAFSPSGYMPDPHPRFALVEVPSVVRAEGTSTVSLTTYVGAMVSSDEGPPLPGEPLLSPFTLTLPPGTYSFQIEAGAATADIVVSRVTLAAGRSYVLAPYGSTTSFRVLADQFAVPTQAPSGSNALFAPSALASRRLAGIAVLTWVVGLFVLAMLLRLATVVTSEGRGIGFAIDAIPLLLVVMRLAPLLTHDAAAVLAILPACAAVAFAARAASSRSAMRVPRSVLAALVAVAGMSTLLGDASGALSLLVPSTLGAVAAAAALEAEVEARWLGLTCVAVAGILPGVGASFGLASAAASTFGVSASGQRWGWVLAPLLTSVVLLDALGLFRMYDANIRSRSTVVAPRGARWLVGTLAVATALVGSVLGGGTSTFGGRFVPVARRLVGGGGASYEGPQLAAAGLAFTVAAAALGLACARRASRTQAIPEWVAALGALGRRGTRGLEVSESLLRFFARSVVIMNDDVIDDVSDFVGGAFHRFRGRGLHGPSAAEARAKLIFLWLMVTLAGAIVGSSLVRG